jgi:tRNA (guanine-N7-)-methyltransferase
MENQGEILYAHHNIYNNSNAPQVAVAIQTFYEQQFLDQGKAITYMQFKL